MLCAWKSVIGVGVGRPPTPGRFSCSLDLTCWFKLGPEIGSPGDPHPSDFVSDMSLPPLVVDLLLMLNILLGELR